MPAARRAGESGTCRAPTPGRSTTSPRRSTARRTRPTRTPPSPRTTTTLVTGVAGRHNAVGFFGYAYYAENTDKLKAVEIDGGDGCVDPTERVDQRQQLLATGATTVHLPELRRPSRIPPSSHSWTTTSPTRRPSPPRSATWRCRTRCSQSSRPPGPQPSPIDPALTPLRRADSTLGIGSARPFILPQAHAERGFARMSGSVAAPRPLTHRKPVSERLIETLLFSPLPSGS